VDNFLTHYSRFLWPFAEVFGRPGLRVNGSVRCPPLGGRLKTGNLSTGQNRQLSPAAETSEFYFAASSVRKSAWTLVRQLRGPHLSTCA
jgi:hypothetical protein